MSVALPLVLALLSAPVPCTGSGPGCTVEVEVNGRDLAMVVDTGADLTVLTTEGARRAGLRVGRDAPYIIVRGVAGQSVARLARTTVQVGDFEEEDVLVAVIDDLDLGRRAAGLLGMSFLERFRTQMGGQLALEPIDAGDRDTKGGRGRAWWSLRFRQVRARLQTYQSLMNRAKALDREVESQFGRSASGDNLEDMMQRLAEFMEAEQSKLQNQAARAAVPLEWRR